MVRWGPATRTVLLGIYPGPEIPDLCPQVPDLLLLADRAGLLTGDTFINTFRRVSMSATCVAGLDTVTLAAGSTLAVDKASTTPSGTSRLERESGRTVPRRSERPVHTLTLRSRQTLHERDWRFGAFLTRKSGAGCRVSPSMGTRQSKGGKGRKHYGPTTRRDLGESDLHGQRPRSPARGPSRAVDLSPSGPSFGARGLVLRCF